MSSAAIRTRLATRSLFGSTVSGPTGACDSGAAVPSGGSVTDGSSVGGRSLATAPSSGGDGGGPASTGTVQVRRPAARKSLPAPSGRPGGSGPALDRGAVPLGAHRSSGTFEAPRTGRTGTLRPHVAPRGDRHRPAGRRRDGSRDPGGILAFAPDPVPTPTPVPTFVPTAPPSPTPTPTPVPSSPPPSGPAASPSEAPVGGEGRVEDATPPIGPL